MQCHVAYAMRHDTFGLRLLSMTSVLPNLIHSWPFFSYRNAAGSLLEKWSRSFKRLQEMDSSTCEKGSPLAAATDDTAIIQNQRNRIWGVSVVCFIWNNLIMWRSLWSHAHNLVEHCAIVMTWCVHILVRILVTKINSAGTRWCIVWYTREMAPSLSVMSFPDHIDSFQWQEH